jgi:hypothetical protein
MLRPAIQAMAAVRNIRPLLLRITVNILKAARRKNSARRPILDSPTYVDYEGSARMDPLMRVI